MAVPCRVEQFGYHSGLSAPLNLPVFLVADPKHGERDFGHCIALFDEPLEEPLPRNEPAARRRMISGFAQAYKEVRVLERPKKIELVGANGTESTWRYLHELDDGRSCSLKVRSLMVFRPPRVHTYHLVDIADLEYVRRDIFDGFIRTIRYEAT